MDNMPYTRPMQDVESALVMGPQFTFLVREMRRVIGALFDGG